MIAPSRSAAYRRFYLYSAFSVAVIAVAVAAVVLLRLGLSSVWGLRPSTDEVSRNVSLAVALLVIAVPVGAAHLWFIVRSLADPAEGGAGVRHQYLNLWVAFALLVVLFSGQAAFQAQVSTPGMDVTLQASILAVAAIVGALASWWISGTPPASPAARIRSAVVVMLVAIAVAAFAVGNAASGAGGMWQNAFLHLTPIDPNLRGGAGNFEVVRQRSQEGAFSSGLLVAGLALTIWSFAFAWQRRWTESRDRLAYAVLAYGLGVATLLIGLPHAISDAIRFVNAANQRNPFTTAWPLTVAGVLLVCVHATLLLRDRGRNGHPAVTTTRLLLAFPALVGLGLIVAGLSLAWHALLERDTATAAHLADDLIVGATLALTGLAAYVPAWVAFDARTTAESGVRRFYLFSVVCLALVGGLVSGVVILYNAITALTGVGDRDAPLTALTGILPAVLLTAIFAVHLRWLVRDQRLTHATEVPAADPLTALLEDVRAGRVSVEAAAARLRLPGA